MGLVCIKGIERGGMDGQIMERGSKTNLKGGGGEVIICIKGMKWKRI